MAVQVVWSPQALEDLELIAEYIARDSAHYAKSVVRDMIALARSLVQFPNRGRIVPETDDPAVRERFLHSYRLIYQVEHAQIRIIAVIHGHRLLCETQDRV